MVKNKTYQTAMNKLKATATTTKQKTYTNKNNL